MSDDLREAIARAMEADGHPDRPTEDAYWSTPCTGAHYWRSHAQAALDAITAAGWTLEPPPLPLPTEEELRVFRAGVGKAMDEVRRRYDKLYRETD